MPRQTTAICSLYCSSPHYARGYCAIHYRRWLRTGQTELQPKQPKRHCSVEQCTRPYSARAYCKKHLRRFDLYGDPLGKHPNYRTDPAVRFWKFVDKGNADGCWLWTGRTTKFGYGQFQVAARKSVLAHRFVYELEVGPIPVGLTLDHVKARGCGGHACVRSSHLEPVTSKVNTLRGDGMGARYARRVTCNYGHAFDLIMGSKGRKFRGCSQCRRMWDARRRDRRRAASSQQRLS